MPCTIVHATQFALATLRWRPARRSHTGDNAGLWTKQGVAVSVGVIGPEVRLGSSTTGLGWRFSLVSIVLSVILVAVYLVHHRGVVAPSIYRRLMLFGLVATIVCEVVSVNF